MWLFYENIEVGPPTKSNLGPVMKLLRRWRYDRHFVGITRLIVEFMLSGEDLSSCSSKTESDSLRKCPYDHWLTGKAHLSATAVTNISQSFCLHRWRQKSSGSHKHLSVFAYKMAAEISWHRYGTKSRHCHPVYSPKRSINPERRTRCRTLR